MLPTVAELTDRPTRPFSVWAIRHLAAFRKGSMTVNDQSQAGRIILTVPLAAGIVAFLAFQANTTHVFNPKWHQNARFHTIQLGLFFIALSGTGL